MHPADKPDMKMHTLVMHDISVATDLYNQFVLARVSVRVLLSLSVEGPDGWPALVVGALAHGRLVLAVLLQGIHAQRLPLHVR